MSGDWEVIDWRGLYSEGWAGAITAEAFSHPAKYARALIRRIYQEMTDRGWLSAGDTVIDPFGGVALGAFDALRLGLHWRGVELEPRFVRMGGENIDLWLCAMQSAGRCGTAVLARGDSRNLRAVLGRSSIADGVVTSPVYLDARQGWATPNGAENIRYGKTAGQLGALPEGDAGAVVSSPPFLQTSGGVGVKPGVAPGSVLADPRLIARHAAGNQAAEGYGADAANLGNLAAGDVDGVISSPPYSPDGKHDSTRELRDGRRGKNQGGGSFRQTYGKADGQLGNMPLGEDAVISSPPYEEQPGHVKPGIDWVKANRAGDSGGRHHAPGAPILNPAYGNAAGQIGSRKGGDTFWSAAREIVTESYLALRPGGHAAWVVKGFVKNKKLVDFPGNWRRLCESVGFVTVAEVRAWVTEDGGSQPSMLGEVAAVSHFKERKSFFRRLAEKNGAPRIDFETVWLMEKR